MTDTFRKWTIWTSISLFEFCVLSWKNHMWNHLDRFPNEDRMRDLFWHYLNYGNTTTYYQYK